VEFSEEQKDVKSHLLSRFVRIVISDDREFTGRFKCIDKDRSIYIENGYEIFNRKDPNYYEHELFKSLIHNKEDDFFYKYVGGVIIPGRHIKAIKLEKDVTELYEKKLSEHK